MPKRTFTGLSGQAYTEVTGSVYEALFDDPQHSFNLEVRAFLLDQIRSVIKARRWTQYAAARVLRTKQPRISALMQGRISEFSLDALVEYTVRAGLRIEVATADSSDAPLTADAPVWFAGLLDEALGSHASHATTQAPLYAQETKPEPAHYGSGAASRARVHVLSDTWGDSIDAANDYSCAMAA